MNLRHQLCALFLLALWLPYYAHCVQPHCAPPIAAGESCDHNHHEHGHDHDGDTPCGEFHRHDPPAVGHSLLKVLPPPVTAALAEWLCAILEEIPPVASPLIPVEQEDGLAPPLPVLLVCTALPVRGPSI